MRNRQLLNIILWALIIGVVVAAGTYYFIHDEYDATSKIEINSKETEKNLLTAMKSDQILDKIIDDNNLTVKKENLSQATTINNKENEYSVNVSYNNKNDSNDLTNMYVTTVEKELGNIVSVDNVKVVNKSNVENVKNISTLPRALYIGAGLLIGALVGLLINVLGNPRNKKREPSERKGSITKYPVLGSIRVY